MEPNDQLVKAEGVVEEALPGLLFRVRTPEGNVLAHLRGKLKINRIRVIPGDRVILEMMVYDKTRGRIIRRL